MSQYEQEIIEAALDGYVACQKGIFPPRNPHAPCGVWNNDGNVLGHAWFNGYWARAYCRRGEPRAKVIGVDYDPKNPEYATMQAVNSMQAAVERFHEKFGHTIGKTPEIRRAQLRAKLIGEESLETIMAISRGDLVEAVDGMCDLLYVIFGTAVEFGINLQPFFDEVHRSNMDKVGGATREDGKTLKPPGWEGPRIKEMLEALGWYDPNDPDNQEEKDD